MYTRFKSQKSGLKLGMNSLANTTTTSSARVATKSTTSSSSSSTVTSLPIKSQLMSSSNLTSTTSGVGSTGSSIHHSSASSSTVSLTPSSSTQSINTLVNNLNSIETTTHHHLPSDPIVLNADIDFNNNEPVMHLHLPFIDNKPATTTIPLIINEDSDSLKVKSKKMAKLAAAKKSNNLVENTEEPPIDLNSVTYVKSKWEKVKSELDKDSGPQRYQLNDNSQYPHLSNFVAFDIENWWTERVFSSMINEETPIAKSNMTMNDTRSLNTRITTSGAESTTNFKLDSQFLMSATARLTNGSSSYLKSKTTLNQDLIMNSRRLNSMDSSLRYFGNFQSCFS